MTNQTTPAPESPLGNASIPAAIAAVQGLVIPGAILGAFLIQLTAGLTSPQASAVRSVMILSVLLAVLIMVGIAWSITGSARRRIDAITSGDNRPQPQEELAAWREISAFSWRYGVLAAIVGSLVGILPAGALPYGSGAITSHEYLFVMAAGVAAVLITSIGSTILLERMLAQKRVLLLPHSIDAQIAGRAGLNIANKFQVLALALSLISVLVIAPIGYHHLLVSGGDTAGAAEQYPFQAFLVSAILVFLGFSLAYFTTRPVSDFLAEMSRTLVQIEEGDLTKRAVITTTDETAELAVHFNSVIARLQALQAELADEIRVRAEQLDAIFEVGQAALQIQDLPHLIEKVVNQIGDRFGYYFAAIYLIDPAERWAELKGATGAAGQVLLANKHRIDLSERSLIALSISSREMQTLQQTTDAQVNNPLLPYTRSELAMPLQIGDRIFGVLDVHSTVENAFGPQEIKTLQNMANQVAAALENARLYLEAQQSVQEMKASQKSYLKTSWDALTTETPDLGYTVGDDDPEREPDIRVPLMLREQTIGEINLTGGSADWTPEERSIVEAVAAQAALALENARLVEESQASAARDHLLADITSKVWSATTIDGILQTAIRELGRALETDEASIELKLDT